jgi:hypothetical protein
MAQLYRHAARSEFLLDADALARDARNPHDALERQRPSRRRISGDRPKIARVHYLGFLKDGDPRKTVFDRQCWAPGSTLAFDVKGGEKACNAFRLRRAPLRSALAFDARRD